MLRQLIITTILLCCAASAIAQQKAVSAPVAKIDYHQTGAPMPSILLYRVDTVKIDTVGTKKKRRHANAAKKEPVTTIQQKIVTDKDLDNGANLFVMMFNPTCGHCEDQTQRFERSIDLFKKSKLVLMAKPNMQEYLPNFIKSFDIKYFDKIMVGVDSGKFVDETFLYSALPQINIYDKDRKLIKAFAGEVLIDSLKQYIQ